MFIMRVSRHASGQLARTLYVPVTPEAGCTKLGLVLQVLANPTLLSLQHVANTQN